MEIVGRVAIIVSLLAHRESIVAESYGYIQTHTQTAYTVYDIHTHSQSYTQKPVERRQSRK